MNTSSIHLTMIVMLSAVLLPACSNDKPEEKSAKKGVFTPYVEAHNEAQETANLVNEAMRRNEERLQQGD